VANNIKIILDVNIWVSAFISNTMEQQIQAIILQDNVEIMACNELLEELQQTLQKPKLKKYLSVERMQSAIELVKQSVTLIELESAVEICRDNKDDYLLALAKDAQAHLLLTGDKDLLVLKQFEKAQIIKLADYLTNPLYQEIQHTENTMSSTDNYYNHIRALEEAQEVIAILKRYLPNIEQEYKRKIDSTEAAGFMEDYTERLRQKHQRFAAKIEELMQCIERHTNQLEEQKDTIYRLRDSAQNDD
jgi:putative PIN family toxin of toxin-antitoxin system